MNSTNPVVTSISAGPEDTRRIAADLAATWAGDLAASRIRVVALDGPLGAGKTQFAQGLAAALGYTGDVTSPTYTLVHEYPGATRPIYHFDFYRLDTLEEVLALGWDEYQEGGNSAVLLVEWAEKFPQLLPPNTTWIRLSPDVEGKDQNETTRQIEIRTPTNP